MKEVDDAYMECMSAAFRALKQHKTLHVSTTQY